MANTLISIAFVIVCVFLTVVVLMLENMTKAAAVLFMVLAFVLNIVK